MELITRNTDYAVRALLYIAKANKDLVSTAELNAQLNLPRPFMRKVLQILQKEKFLISVKGHNGGFSLAKKPDKIFISDLIKVFQGEICLTGCLLNKEICPNIRVCPIRKKIKRIEKFAVNEFKGVTIGSLL